MWNLGWRSWGDLVYFSYMEDKTVNGKVKRLRSAARRKRKRRTVIPTEKQLKGAANLIKASKEGTPQKYALMDAGYSESTSKNPQLVINSPGFEQALITMGQALDEKGVTDELLAKTHHELVTQRTPYGSLTRLNLQALELAYKVKGHLNEKKEVDHNVTFRWAETESETNEYEVIDV